MFYFQLKDSAADLSFDIDTKTKKTASRRGLSAPVPKEKVPLEPVRKSLRLQRIDADTGLTLPEKEPTSYYMYQDDSPQRPPTTDLTLEEICNNNEDWESTEAYFKDKVVPYMDHESKKSVLNKSIFDDVSKLGQGLKSLKITVSCRLK